MISRERAVNVISLPDRQNPAPETQQLDYASRSSGFQFVSRRVFLALTFLLDLVCERILLAVISSEGVLDRDY